MKLLYCTADKIGETSGGGLVTFNESEALKSLGPCEVLGRKEFSSTIQCYYKSGDEEEPWRWDNWLDYNGHVVLPKKTNLAHFYAGTFSKIIADLKEDGCKVTYTAAAHDVEISRREHERLGFAYNYPHLTDPKLWKRYLAGYAAADVLICPSKHSADVMRRFGCTNRIEVIPHGVNLPDEKEIKPIPKQFTVGYLGSYGPDKGVIYLLQAWKKLNYKDGSQLILAGRDSTSPFVRGLVGHYGGGSIVLAGWQKDVADFYNSLSLYVQSSQTEGFGCEVLEAQAYNRPVLCSTGAGAIDTIPLPEFTFPAGDWKKLAERIKWAKECVRNTIQWQENAARYTWDKIRQRYIAVWKELLQ